MVVSSGTFQKSAKGTQALAARDPALTPKLRSMLILIDGKRRHDELGKLAAMLGDTNQLMAQLAELGMIEEVAGTASAPSPLGPGAPTSAPSPLETEAPAVTLAEAQRYAVRRLTDLLGPTAEELCLRIEGTRNAAEFHAVIKRAEGVVRDFGGADAARSFLKDLASHRPA